MDARKRVTSACLPPAFVSSKCGTGGIVYLFYYSQMETNYKPFRRQAEPNTSLRDVSTGSFPIEWSSEDKREKQKIIKEELIDFLRTDGLIGPHTHVVERVLSRLNDIYLSTGLVSSKQPPPTPAYHFPSRTTWTQQMRWAGWLLGDVRKSRRRVVAVAVAVVFVYGYLHARHACPGLLGNRV